MQNFVNDFVIKEKNVCPSSQLCEKIMQCVDGIYEQETKKTRTVFLQSLAVAASFAAVIAMGVALGNSHPVAPYEPTLLINDSYVEMLHLYQNFPG